MKGWGFRSVTFALQIRLLNRKGPKRNRYLSSPAKLADRAAVPTTICKAAPAPNQEPDVNEELLMYDVS